MYVTITGTAGNIQWKLEVNGKAFHSGLPHKGMYSVIIILLEHCHPL